MEGFGCVCVDPEVCQLGGLVGVVCDRWTEDRWTEPSQMLGCAVSNNPVVHHARHDRLK